MPNKNKNSPIKQEKLKLSKKIYRDEENNLSLKNSHQNSNLSISESDNKN